MQRNLSLDGLRGIAALAVVLSHVANMTWMPEIDKRDPVFYEWLLWHLGAPAVDIFLVLSGYVITKSLLRTPQKYTDYLISRMIRLYPVAWTAVLIGMTVRAMDLSPIIGMTSSLAFDENLGAKDILGFMTMIAPMPNYGAVNPPLWSLVLEMQAALMMPFLAKIARQNVVYLGIFAFMIMFVMVEVTRTVYPIYFSGFVVGTILAAKEDSIPAAPRPYAILAVATIMLFMRHYLSSLDIGDPSFRIPVAIAASGILIAILQGAGKAFFESRLVQWFGNISYPLYAVHWPIMAAFTMMVGKTMGIATAAIASIPIAIAAAWIVSIAIDRPAIKFAKIIKTQRKSLAKSQPSS